VVKRLRVSNVRFPLLHTLDPRLTLLSLQLFRTAHRTRAKVYLSQPAPERLPMTAGKSLLKSDMEQSLEYLDEFMVGRLAKTV